MKDKKPEPSHKNQLRHSQNDILHSIDSFFSHSPLKGLLQQMDDFFGNSFTHATLPVETKETDREYLIACKLPGIKKEQITIETFDHSITISVHHEEETKATDEQATIFSKSYSLNHATRTIPVPAYLKIQSLQAKYRDGLLQIRIPKKNTRQISIED